MTLFTSGPPAQFAPTMTTVSDQLNGVAGEIIACAIAVRRHPGPGLLERIYEEAMVREMSLRSISFERQVRVPVQHKGVGLGMDYHIDLTIPGVLIAELKVADALLPVHVAQLLTCLRLTNVRVGLPINFHVQLLRLGIKRLVM